MDIVDILFHVTTHLRAQDRAEIERDIQGCEGVISAQFSRYDPHLLEVAYNPRVTDSERLRRHVSERGLPVSKIGL